jgi:hypothetical protein
MAKKLSIFEKLEILNNKISSNLIILENKISIYELNRNKIKYLSEISTISLNIFILDLFNTRDKLILFERLINNIDFSRELTFEKLDLFKSLVNYEIKINNNISIDDFKKEFL